MTRLKTEWVEPMLDGMDAYNLDLISKIGVDLAGLAKYTFGISDESFNQAQKVKKVGVVPITQGEGIIGKFSESIAAIVKSMGFDAEVMEHTDVNGIYDGICKGMDVLFMADDDRYLAINLNGRDSSDNNYATALGYINALKLMASKQGAAITEEDTILVIGYGIVGKEAAKILDAKGLNYVVYDKNPEVQAQAVGHQFDKECKLRDYKFILDFTNVGDWLSEEELHDEACYSSPGVPCSLTEAARMSLGNRAVFDNLEIGTAIMLGETLAI